MAAFPVEVLLGVYLGILTGIIPAGVAWGLGFLFKYFTGISIPAFGVVVLSLAIAGANGGLLVLADPTVTEAPNRVTLTTAILVVLMISLFAHAQGDETGGNFPRHISLHRLRDRTLSSDVIELVGRRGQVRVTVAGEVEDVEGYPPLSDVLRAEIREGEWTFPADLPLSELETRLSDTLRTEFDLADVSVVIDERASATVFAAPVAAGVSKRVPVGERAISIHTLVPTGLARGDEVTVQLDDGPIDGTVVSARSSMPGADTGIEPTGSTASPDGGKTPEEPDRPETAPLPRTPTTDGGDGRLTIAVSRDDAARLIEVERAHVVVRARGTRREFELLSLLRRAGRQVREVTVGADGQLAGVTIGEPVIRDTYDVGVLAVRKAEGWTLAPPGSTEIEPDDELYVVGGREQLQRFTEAIA